VVASRSGLSDGVDGQKRGLGLHVVHVARVGYPGPLHGDLDRVRNLSDHLAPPDVFGKQYLAHRVSDREPRLVATYGAGLWHCREPGWGGARHPPRATRL